MNSLNRQTRGKWDALPCIITFLHVRRHLLPFQFQRRFLVTRLCRMSLFQRLAISFFLIIVTNKSANFITANKRAEFDFNKRVAHPLVYKTRHLVDEQMLFKIFVLYIK